MSEKVRFYQKIKVELGYPKQIIICFLGVFFA